MTLLDDLYSHTLTYKILYIDLKGFINIFKREILVYTVILRTASSFFLRRGRGAFWVWGRATHCDHITTTAVLATYPDSDESGLTSLH